MQGAPLHQLADTGGHMQEGMDQFSQTKSTGSIW